MYVPKGASATQVHEHVAKEHGSPPGPLTKRSRTLLVLALPARQALPPPWLPPEHQDPLPLLQLRQQAPAPTLPAKGYQPPSLDQVLVGEQVARRATSAS